MEVISEDGEPLDQLDERPETMDAIMADVDSPVHKTGPSRSDLNRMIADSEGSFIGLKDSIQNLLTKFRSAFADSPSANAGSPGAEIRTSKRTAEVKPNQHRSINEEKENVGERSNRASVHRDDQPAPWWSSESSRDSDTDTSERDDMSDGGHLGYVRHFADERGTTSEGESSSSDYPYSPPSQLHATTGVRRCLFRNRPSEGARVVEVENAIAYGDESKLEACSKRSKWTRRNGIEYEFRRPMKPANEIEGRSLLTKEDVQPNSPGVAAVASLLASTRLQTPKANEETNGTTPPSKYRAREVLMGKGQLKLELYINSGLLTVFVKKAKKITTKKMPFSNSYVKVEMIPKHPRNPSCRTLPIRKSNCPVFNQKFSLTPVNTYYASWPLNDAHVQFAFGELSPEDEEKRLFISLWHRDLTKRNSEFLGCMSFGVAHVMRYQVDGWFRILTARVGKVKHFAVKTRRLTSILKKVGKLTPSPRKHFHQLENIRSHMSIAKDRGDFEADSMLPPPCVGPSKSNLKNVANAASAGHPRFTSSVTVNSGCHPSSLGNALATRSFGFQSSVRPSATIAAKPDFRFRSEASAASCTFRVKVRIEPDRVGGLLNSEL